MGSELRAQGRNPCREKGVASEAALSSASRGTPVLSVPLLVPNETPPSRAGFREIGII